MCIPCVIQVLYSAGFIIMRFEVLTAATMKMGVFWAVVPCELVEAYRRFRGACCLDHCHNDLTLPIYTTDIDLLSDNVVITIMSIRDAI
jgi:hypothetical protein